MSIERTLEMAFTTTSGKNHTLRVYAARESITDTEVSAVMDDIITRNIFEVNGGDLNGKASARLVSREVLDYTVS